MDSFIQISEYFRHQKQRKVIIKWLSYTYNWAEEWWVGIQSWWWWCRKLHKDSEEESKNIYSRASFISTSQLNKLRVSLCWLKSKQSKIYCVTYFTSTYWEDVNFRFFFCSENGSLAIKSIFKVFCLLWNSNLRWFLHCCYLDCNLFARTEWKTFSLLRKASLDFWVGEFENRTIHKIFNSKG